MAYYPVPAARPAARYGRSPDPRRPGDRRQRCRRPARRRRDPRRPHRRHQPRASGPAHRVIDARGQVVAPGFIDIHTHSDFTLPLEPAGGKQDPPGRDAGGRRQLRLLGGAGAAGPGRDAARVPRRERDLAGISRDDIRRLHGHAFRPLGERDPPGRPQHAAADDGRAWRTARSRPTSWPRWSACWKKRSPPAPGAVVRPLHRARQLRRRRRDAWRSGRAAAPRRRVLHARARRGRSRLRGGARGDRRRPRPPASTCRSPTSSSPAWTTGAARPAPRRDRGCRGRGVPVDCDAYPYTARPIRCATCCPAG